MEEISSVVSDEIAQSIVESGAVYTYFQPVINLPRKSVLGFEASNKGGAVALGEPVRLSEMCFEGCAPEMRIKIDRLCREKALEDFRILHAKQGWLKLFLAVDASILQFEQSDFTYLMKQVEESGLPPESIIIEASLDTVINHIPVEIDTFYREYGFKTCVSNVNIDQPFLDCLLRFEPTYMKIGDSLLPGSPGDSYRTRMLAGLMDFSRKTGTTMIGTNVDSLNESVQMLHAGIVHQQGSYFTLSDDEGDTGAAKTFFSNIQAAYGKFKEGHEEIRAKLRQEFSGRMSLASSIAAKLSGQPAVQFGVTLEKLINENLDIGMGYVLDDAGIQILPAICNRRMVSEDGPLSDTVPADGTDHSIEEMFLHLDAGVDRYVSPAYASPVVGLMCFSVVNTFYCQSGLRHILVLEMLYPS